MPRINRHDLAVDFYQLLQVVPTATIEVIQAAYKALMLKHAPRLNTDTETIAKQLNQARDILTDTTLRREYDRQRRLVPNTNLGSYRILEPIAEGAIGQTYKGEHIRSGGLVCIKHCKFLDSVATDLMVKEALTMWDLRHYSVPAIHDIIDMDDGSVALVMSYIEGPTLEQVVKQYGRLDAETVLWIAQRVFNALAYMHQHGVIHGDIKPQNIIIQEKNHMAVLVDFGLAMVNPTSLSHNIGFTELFSPPEQQEDSRGPLLPQSDFYSLGTTMLYALSAKESMVRARSTPDDTPEPVRQFIRKLVRQDVLTRPKWGKDDPVDELVKIRQEVFGRSHSNFKPIGSPA
jgi:serine/threonine protein kinase